MIRDDKFGIVPMLVVLYGHGQAKHSGGRGGIGDGGSGDVDGRDAATMSNINNRLCRQDLRQVNKRLCRQIDCLIVG